MTKINASVDVVIPAYNAAKFIVQALDSVVAQGSCIASITIVDDGSIDKTLKILNDYINHPRNLKIQIISQSNAGPAAARNAGISCGNSEFVAFLDADDVWLPGKISRQLAMFENSTFHDLGVVYCGYALLNEEGKQIENKGFKLDPRVRGKVSKKLLCANLIAGSASAVLIKRSLLDQVGYFDINLVCSEDWDLWLRLSEKGTFDFIDDELVLLRQHPNNSQKNEKRMLSGEVMFLNKLYLNRRVRWYHFARIWRRLILGGVSARKLEGFDHCEPMIRYCLEGFPIKIAGFFLKNYMYVRSGVRGLLLKLHKRSGK